MSTATVTPPPVPQAQAPAPAARMTAEEFARKYDGQHVEYVNGEVREVPMCGGRHGNVCSLFGYLLAAHTLPNNLGRVFTNDTFVKVPTKSDPERVYGADVRYIPYTKLAKGTTVPDGVLPVTPDLVVEVRSPSDTWIYVIAKVVDYLHAGVPVVIVLDPKTRSASVFRDQDRQDIFEADEELTLPDLLPGLSVPVAPLFE